MTPKEKAQELIDKFYQKQCDVLLKSGTAPLDEVEFQISKQCAIIAVEEILNACPIELIGNAGKFIYTEHYWNEVKDEIEKL